jgi:hypothetical protein
MNTTMSIRSSPKKLFDSFLASDAKLFIAPSSVKAIADQVEGIILPESWTRGLVKKSLNLTKRYDQTNPTQIHA